MISNPLVRDLPSYIGFSDGKVHGTLVLHVEAELSPLDVINWIHNQKDIKDLDYVIQSARKQKWELLNPHEDDDDFRSRA